MGPSKEIIKGRSPARHCESQAELFGTCLRACAASAGERALYVLSDRSDEFLCYFLEKKHNKYTKPVERCKFGWAGRAPGYKTARFLLRPFWAPFLGLDCKTGAKMKKSQPSPPPGGPNQWEACGSFSKALRKQVLPALSLSEASIWLRPLKQKTYSDRCTLKPTRENKTDILKQTEGGRAQVPPASGSRKAACMASPGERVGFGGRRSGASTWTPTGPLFSAFDPKKKGTKAETRGPLGVQVGSCHVFYLGGVDGVKGHPPARKGTRQRDMLCEPVGFEENLGAQRYESQLGLVDL